MANVIENPEVGEQVAVALAGGVVAIGAAAFFVREVFKVDVMTKPKSNTDKDGKEIITDEKLTTIESLRVMVNEGAISFLNTEYFYVGLFALVLSIALGFILIQDGDELAGLYTAINLLVGATLSAAAGYFGMLIATAANTRTTLACVDSMTEGLKVSFASGAVMANAVVGLGIIGVSLMYLIFESSSANGNDRVEFQYLSGFAFGGSSVALFARVGGGIFTKAADVGADLVGKVEAGIPEDDPRNPAVIADNVGDNVGDVAGMGADLFESFVSSIIAAGTLAADDTQVAYPFWVAGTGVALSLVGVAYVRCQKLDPNTATLSTLLGVIRGGIAIAVVLATIGALVSAIILFDGEDAYRAWGCTLIGLVSGEIIGTFTEYVTSYEDPPTRGIADAGKFGHAPVVIKGLGVGMLSVIVPTLAIGATVIACNEIFGLYGIAVSAVGMLSTLGITLATDAYGPVADNAGGIAEMADLPDSVRDKTDKLDSLGNTTAATGKGFAIGSAVLTSVALIVSYLSSANLTAAQVGVSDPTVIIGALIGAMLPFVFAALTMLSVDRAARAIITEVRLQFSQAPDLVKQDWETEDDYEAKYIRLRDAYKAEVGAEASMNRIKGIDGNLYPDSNRCVAIATQSAIYEMILPGGAAILSPVIIGYLLGAASLGGLLIGSLTSGFMLALTMSNAGGAWDNAKKWVEKCGSEGEPLDSEDVAVEGIEVKWTTYGVKKASKARGLLQEYAAKDALHLITDRDLEGLKERTNGFAAGNAEWEEWKQDTAEQLAKFFKGRKDPVVSGDTVGDPFKDTSGPALNILIKLTSIVSLVLAPTLRERQTSFEDDSWWIAIIVLVVAGVAGYFITTAINKSFSDREEEAATKLAAARKAAEKKHRMDTTGGAAPSIVDAADVAPAVAAEEGAAAATEVPAEDATVDAAAQDEAKVVAEEQA